ncbi:MAG: hypothetical protein AB7Q01_15020 [Gammaproteobacteria bacterium]
MGSILGGKSKTTTETKVPPPSAQEIALTNQQLDLASQQLQNLSGFTNFTQELFAQFLPVLANEVNAFLPQEKQLTADTLGFASQAVGAQGELLSRELDAIRGGVALTPDQEKLISDSASHAIEAGLSDIGRFRDDSLRVLTQETSTARGLRPDDTPIVDVGGQIVNESSRQAAQLINSIRSQEAQQRLQYPIDAGRFVAERTQGQQAFAADTAKFVQDLRQAAFNNRLNLTATTGNVGATASQIGPSPYTLNALTQARLGSATTTTTTKKSGGLTDFITGAASLASGIGGLATGLSNVGLGFAKAA